MLTAPALTKAGLAFGQVLPFVHADARMRHETLRILLEVGGDSNRRNIVLDGEEIADHVAAHEELDLAGDQQHAPVRGWAALQDRDVKPVFLVGAVDQSLVIAAGLRIGEPVGPEGHLVERQGRLGQARRQTRSAPQ